MRTAALLMAAGLLAGCGGLGQIESRTVEVIREAEAAADRVRDAAVEDGHDDVCERMRVGDLRARTQADPTYAERHAAFCHGGQ